MIENKVEIGTVVVDVAESKDPTGDYVCVTFSTKVKQQSSPVSFEGLPEGFADIGSQIVQIVQTAMPPVARAQMNLAPRVAIWFTVDEWEALDRKYTIGDYVTFRVDPRGRIMGEVDDEPDRRLPP